MAPACDKPERSAASRLHRVARIRVLSGGCFALEVEGPILPTLPGQFYMLRTRERWPVLLPRPFSLYERGEDGLEGSFLIKAVGPGTQALRDLQVGEEVWVTGPMGGSFPLEGAAAADPVCVAGGIGLAPFWLWARHQQAAGRPKPRLLFGGRDATALAGMQDFEAMTRLHTATDDGSHGFHGLVTALMEDLIAKGEIAGAGETVYCCGPDPMMHAVAELAQRHGMKCYLSLETYMACGYGVCNGCTVEVRGERFGDWPYAKTCMQGPVFAAEELVGL